MCPSVAAVCAQVLCFVHTVQYSSVGCEYGCLCLNGWFVFSRSAPSGSSTTTQPGPHLCEEDHQQEHPRTLQRLGPVVFMSRHRFTRLHQIFVCVIYTPVYGDGGELRSALCSSQLVEPSALRFCPDERNTCKWVQLSTTAHVSPGFWDSVVDVRQSLLAYRDVEALYWNHMLLRAVHFIFAGRRSLSCAVG